MSDINVLDAQSVLENLDYDLDTFRELVEMYLADYADAGDQLAEKLAGDDLKDIKQCAHALKGIGASIGGLRLADIANRIQEQCRAGNKPDCAEWAPLVTAQSAALKNALELLDWSALELLAAEN